MSAKSRRPSSRPPARSSGPGGARPRPGGRAPQRQSPPRPAASPAGATRRAVERRSAAVLLYLHQLPRWLPTLVLGVLFFAGLFAGGVLGAVLVAVVALFLGWLLYLSWPLLAPGPRRLRLLAVGLLVALVVMKLVDG